MEFYYLKLLSLLASAQAGGSSGRAVYPELVGYKGVCRTKLVREKAFAPADSFIEEKTFIWAGSLMP